MSGLPLLDLLWRGVFQLGHRVQRVQIGIADQGLPQRHGRHNPDAGGFGAAHDVSQFSFIEMACVTVEVLM
jgi:hypothetical protein